METRAHHVLIGLFTVLGATAALLFALWLGKSSADREFNHFVVIFNEAVTGLSAGNAVQYNGIRVGDVTDLRLNPADPREVQVGIRVRADAPVKKNTEARLAMTGITGLSIIQLYGGSPDSPLLASPKNEPARIVATPSPLTRLMANGEDFVVSVKTLLTSTNALLSETNVQKISAMIADLQAATHAVAGQRGEVRDMLQGMNAATQEATRALQESRALLQNTNALVNGPGRESIETLNRTMASLEKTSGVIEQLMVQNQAAVAGGLRGMADLGPAMAELRSTLANLRQTTRQLGDGGAGGLLSREQNREFQP